MKYNILYNKINICVNIRLMIIFLITFVNTSLPQKGNFQTKEYTNAVEALQRNDTTSAIDLLNTSIKKNNDASSCYILSNIFWLRQDYESRNKAYELARKAVLIDSYNLDYKYFFAKICKDFAKYEAINQWEEIVTIDSSQIKAYINLAEFYEIEFIEWNKSYRRNYLEQDFDPPISLDFDLEKWNKENEEKAIKYFNKALEIDSLDYELCLKLSLFYFKIDKPYLGIKHLKKLINNNIKNKNIYLALGVLFHSVQEEEESYKAFIKAFDLMSDDERDDFRINSVISFFNIGMGIESNQEQKKLLKFIDDFWKSRDPLLLTTYNERLLEHYSRVAFANLSFETNNNPGWRSDRGEAVIRYGLPYNRIRIRPNLYGGMGSQPKKMGKNSIMPEIIKSELWFYDSFTIKFEDEWLNNNYQFARDQLLFIDNLRDNIGSDYKPKFKGPILEILYNTLQFRNGKDNSKTDVYVNYLIRRNDGLSNIENNKLIEGLFYFDDNFNKIHSHQDTIIINNKADNIYSIKFSSKEGSGNLALEINRKADDGIAAYHGKYKIKDYSNGKLMLSDFVLARSIDSEFAKERINRGDLSITSSPSNIFNKNEPIFLYYEIYNLGLDEEKLTNFDQEISIRIIEEDSSIGDILNKIGEVLGIGKEGEKITLTSNYKTLERNSQIYFQLDMKNYPSGEYEIGITIKDKIGQKETSGKVLIKWINE